MNTHSHIVIIGGGLAGLTCAIHLAKANIPVTLIEKDTYPKHKVCGEYISNEVLPYFDFLNIDIESLQPAKISNFTISTQKGNVINSKLPLGGFGISRYRLDHYLWEKAAKMGVTLLTDHVTDVTFIKNSIFQIKTNSNKLLTSDYVIGAYGKRSQLDQTLKRTFSTKKSPWLAVKSHYNANFDRSTVELHNFKGGYCGLSTVEDNRVNACYLVSYDSFKQYKNLAIFEEEVLCKNVHLNSFFKEAIPLFDKPITISQVNFSKKQSVENHMFMLGDTAGLIHPLCGNGMAMAIKSAQIISKLLIENSIKTNKLSRNKLENAYAKQWKVAFSQRLFVGRLLQKVLLNKQMQETSYRIANAVPIIVPKIIKQTHGGPILC